MDERGIVRIVRRGVLYLAESLWDYWPASGENDIPERNISVHAARAFAEQGFRCYAEVNPRDRTDRRLDLLAFDPDREVLAILESKKLHVPEQLEGMLKDAERIIEFQPHGRESDQVGRAARFGILVATTWKDEAAAWWAATDGSWDAGEARWNGYPKERGDLSRRMNDALFGSIIVRGYDGQKSSEPFHYILYCVFRAGPA